MHGRREGQDLLVPYQCPISDLSVAPQLRLGGFFLFSIQIGLYIIHIHISYGCYMSHKFEVEGEELMEKEVKSHGSGGIVYAKKEWVGRKVALILLPDEEGDANERGRKKK